jgi:peptidyl-dipeptidase Dcp
MNSIFKITLVPAVLLFGFTSINNPTHNTMAKKHTNPFFSASKLPFQAPPFDKIQDTDYQPAIEKGMKDQLDEINKIADNKEAPTFDNTFVALEKSGQLLKRVTLVFNAVTDANSDSLLEKVREEEAPKLAAHSDAIFLNTKLFKRVKTIYDKMDRLKLDPESKRLVKYYYDKFVHAGTNLSDQDKEKLKKINEEEATLIAQFISRLLAATKEGAFVVSDSLELKGLSTSALEAASQEASSRGLTGKWLIPLQNTTQQPDLQVLENRDTRKQLFENSWNRAERNDSNDTRAVIERIAKIRADKAKLLGFPNYAAWTLTDQMAKTPDRVHDFLESLTPPTMAGARKEALKIQNYMDETGAKIKLEPWDWSYYSEKLRKKLFDLDDSQIKPYFVLNNVLEKGVFYAAQQLYGLTFKERHDIPVYQKDVRVFEIFDKDGSPLALYYADLYKRDNKSGGAWMDNMVQQSKLLGIKANVYNVTNFTKPAEGEPALLSYDDVTTLFHEFGHALHEIFGHTEYPSLAGSNTPRDFVEFPSQFNEHWALYPKVLEHYAINYKTGKPMPEELADKIKAANLFNQGYDFTEIIEASALDMAWHTLPASAPKQNADTFEIEALKKDSLYIPEVPPRYRSSYFTHIWRWGYAAGYYAYTWAEMLDDDAFNWFETHGGLTRENGDRFREMILSKGATEDYNKIFEEFTGHKPSLEPLFKNRGLE